MFAAAPVVSQPAVGEIGPAQDAIKVGPFSVGWKIDPACRPSACKISSITWKSNSGLTKYNLYDTGSIVNLSWTRDGKYKSCFVVDPWISLDLPMDHYFSKKKYEELPCGLAEMDASERFEVEEATKIFGEAFDKFRLFSKKLHGVSESRCVEAESGPPAPHGIRCKQYSSAEH
ncbi:hypothetical protein [Sandaracinobacteroides hominis]|uniref:hypothetical protein n=1 Tax=Sandaracinobacteroides hominis TaxID=2780086 RepID=UPI0018F40815|nr:hypothetical protein [Sandaracinobacteroides hominis]